MRIILIIALILYTVSAFTFETGNSNKNNNKDSPTGDIEDIIRKFRLYSSACLCRRKNTGEDCTELECCDLYEYVPEKEVNKICHKGVTCRTFDTETMTIVE